MTMEAIMSDNATQAGTQSGTLAQEQRGDTGHVSAIESRVIGAMSDVWEVARRDPEPISTPTAAWQGETRRKLLGAVARAERSRWSDPDGLCEWFALCPEPATALRSHPLLVEVPVCERHRRWNP